MPMSASEITGTRPGSARGIFIVGISRYFPERTLPHNLHFFIFFEVTNGQHFTKICSAAMQSPNASAARVEGTAPASQSDQKRA